MLLKKKKSGRYRDGVRANSTFPWTSLIFLFRHSMTGGEVKGQLSFTRILCQQGQDKGWGDGKSIEGPSPHVSPLKIEKRNVISMPKWVSPPPLIFSPSSKEGHSSPGRVLCIWVLDLPGLPSIVLINFLQCSIEREREREREQDYYIIQKIDPIMLCGYFIDYGALDGVYCPLINVNPSHVRIIGSVLPASLFI